MSKITEYLQKILSARYGRDVRQAIHDSIQQCYEDGKAGGVDLEARQDIEKIESDTAEVKQDIESLEENLANVESIAKGKNQARVFSTTEDMNAWLSDVNNMGVAMKGDNLYIVELDVPDWWIAEVLDAPNASGMYYNIAPLETQKVDLSNYISQDDVIDDLTSTETQKPLSANKGRELSDGISKVNPLKTIYIAEDNIDATLDSTTPQYPYIFGFSQTLNQLFVGYWVHVETSMSVGHIFQKAIGEGGTATRYYNSDKGWTPWNVTAKKSDVCWIKTITATSASNGVVLVANSANGETPLSVVCDTDGYYVGRLFKNQYGLWYATIFDVATVQAVTSEIGVTLYATMKP